MKRLFNVLGFALMLAVLLSSCKSTSKEKLIIGKWSIDSVYYENQEETFHKLADYAVKNATKTKQIVEDSLKNLEQRGLHNAIDSLYYQTYQNQLASAKQMIDYYSDYETFKGDMLKGTEQAKGAIFEFKEDSTLMLPNAQQPVKWYVQDDKLNIVFPNQQTTMDIIELSPKKMVLKSKQDIDSTLSLVVVYMFKKVKSQDQTKK